MKITFEAFLSENFQIFLVMQLMNNQNVTVSNYLVKIGVASLMLALSFGNFSCSLPVKQSTTQTKDSLTRLGQSNYYIALPPDLQVSEARGKEGQLGYNIFLKDTSRFFELFSSVEIEKGNPVLGDVEKYSNKKWHNKKWYIQSNFLGGQIKWTVEQSGEGLFYAKTPNGDITAFALSKDTNNIKKLIKIFATVVKK